MWYVQLGKAQISLCICSLIRAFASRINICVLSFTDKTDLEFLSLKETAPALQSLTLVGNHMSWLK